MAKKKDGVTAGEYHIPAANYDAMVETMIELAMRNAATEGIVLRCAKAGGVKEVVKHVTRMRNYAKKHRIVPRAQAGDGETAAPKRKKAGKRKRTAAAVDHSHGDGASGAKAMEP